MILEVRDLVAGYGEALVLHGVELGLERGEVVALLGRNGMGKTTLLRSLMGLLTPRRGAVRFGGRDVTGLKPHHLARLGIGYVPQGREIFAAFSVDENLRFGLLGRGRRTPSVPPEIYELFPFLAERRKEPAGVLSGGQQQLLAIARALAAKPSLLLLDEPSEGIQPSVVREISALLRRVARDAAVAMLLVEQNVEMVQGTAERCLFIEKGRIVAHHAAAELARTPELLQRYLAI